MSLPRTLIALGLFLLVTGILWEFRDRFSLLSWLGRLPGDITYTSGNMRVYLPLATCIVLSLLVSGTSALVRYLSRP